MNTGFYKLTILTTTQHQEQSKIKFIILVIFLKGKLGPFNEEMGISISLNISHLYIINPTFCITLF